MSNKHGKATDAAREKRLIESLRRHPELMERFEAILELTNSEEGPLRTADEVEEMLVEEVRRLASGPCRTGRAAPKSALPKKCGNRCPESGCEKKSPELVVRLWGGRHRGADLAYAGSHLPQEPSRAGRGSARVANPAGCNEC